MAAMLFYIIQKNYLNKGCLFFLKLYYHM